MEFPSRSELVDLSDTEFLERAVNIPESSDIWKTRFFMRYGFETEFPKLEYVQRYVKNLEDRSVAIFYNCLDKYPGYESSKSELERLSFYAREYQDEAKKIYGNVIRGAESSCGKDVRYIWKIATKLLKLYGYSRKFTSYIVHGDAVDLRQILNEDGWKNFDLLIFHLDIEFVKYYIFYHNKWISIKDLEKGLLKYFKIYISDITFSEILEFYGLSEEA